MSQGTRGRGLCALVVCVGTVWRAGGAEAEAPEGPAADAVKNDTGVGKDELQEVVVSGYREALKSALNLKRMSDVMVDGINAEDVAKFPDSNLAESLQRLPGIAVDRDNGEGRTITVRGLGSDFTRVRLNGLEALATAAAPDSGGSPNRSRGFDFNNFASDLFSSLQVRKTASADTDEGSLGATVDLQTPRPFDFHKDRYAFSAQDAYYEIGGFHRPRIAALMSQTWFDNTLGGAVSFAYNDRRSEINRYRRQPGSGDFLNQQRFTGANPARGGFSAPPGTPFGTSITNPSAIAAMTGSDPAAYAALFPGPPYSTPGRFDDSIVKVPGLINIEQQNLMESRIGLTGSLQWRPTDRTLVNLDGVFSRFHQKSDISQIVDIGMNRNNTDAGYNVANAGTAAGAKRNLYPGCVPRPATPYLAPLDCGGTDAVAGGVFPGLGTTSFSTNPHNLDPYDYYNNPGSVGYPGAVAAAQGMYYRDTLIGRPSTDVLAANVDEAGTADYLMLRNMDARSATDSSYFTTKFTQVSLNLQQEITATLHADVLYGKSSSLNHNHAFLVEFDRMDSPEPFIYDERARGPMPSVSYGFDVADPNNWSLVKGYSVIRHFERETDNRYSGGHLNFKWQMIDAAALEFGWTRREYQFSTNEFRRPGGNIETLNPSLQELGLSAQALGRVYNYGAGLDVPAGTPTSFFAPDMNAFRSVLGFDCNCVNKWGDWRITNLTTPGNQFAVDELDNSYFVQLDWDLDVWRRKFFGNVGVRYAKTAVTSDGYTTNVTLTGPRPLEASNNYHDLLPSLNAAYSLTEDLILRTGVAKVMSRPLLNNLAPSITNLTTPSLLGSTGSLTIGNPKINPFRATNYDFSVEWYFTPGSLLSGAYFIKKVTNYPQVVASAGSIQDLFTAEEFAQFLQTQDPNQQKWLTSGGPNGGPGLYSILQFKDSPGGTIKGYELTYQQNLTFLPWYFRNLGVQFNYTHLSSSLSYILDPGSSTGPAPRPQTTQNGPFIGASPITSNATLFYESSLWSARVSMAYRGRYVTTYPIASGACAPGSQNGVVCTTPLINDFIGSKATRTYDAEVTYNIGEHLTLTLEGLNLTAETDDRWVYQADPIVAQYSAPGRSYFAGFRLQF
jgi:iron complex outermembrane receptor protein